MPAPAGMRTQAWKPSWLTALAFAIALLFPLWLINPIRAGEIGADAKDLYAAASLASRGGNPYDAAQQTAEENRLYNEPHGLRFGDPGAYAPTTYGYPPAVTLLLEPAVAMGPSGFVVLMLVLVPIAGLAALEIVLRVLRWDDRALPRAFMLVSAPLALCEFVGNPSAFLAVAWAAGLALFVRGHSLAAGFVMSLTLLKLPVGLPVALAVVATAPPRPGAVHPRLRGAAGLLGGTLAWLGAGALAGGPGATLAWGRALGLYGAALDRVPALTPYAQFDMIGLPAFLPTWLPSALGALVAAAVVGTLAVVASRRGLAPGAAVDPFALLGLLVSAALLCNPYAHPNDLLFALLPILLLASWRMTSLSRVALSVWAVGFALNALLAIVLALAFHVQRPETRAGFGVVVTALLFAALAVATAGRRWAPEATA